MAVTHRFGEGTLTMSRLCELAQAPVAGEFYARPLERIS